VPTVLKSGSLNLLKLSGPLQACNGIALPFNRGSEVHEVTAPTQTPSSPALNEDVETESQRITVPSFAEEMLQNTAVRSLKGGNPTTGLPGRRLVTRPREIIITFERLC
jgi:hypothetical protein